MRGEREFLHLRFQKCQVWRAVKSRVVRLAVPALRVEGLGESLRCTAVDTGLSLEVASIQAISAGRGGSPAITLTLGKTVSIGREPRSRLGSRRSRWCDSGTAEIVTPAQPALDRAVLRRLLTRHYLNPDWRGPGGP